VRDEIHYLDVIFCKAAVIVDSLMNETQNKGYNSFHLRRGDFQYKVVKIPADSLLHNVGDLLPKSAPLVFIASDEKNASYFDPFHKRFPGKIRRLDDYMDAADLRHINPNYLGMIDQVFYHQIHYHPLGKTAQRDVEAQCKNHNAAECSAVLRNGAQYCAKNRNAD
jgi:hypothetical protein